MGDGIGGRGADAAPLFILPAELSGVISLAFENLASEISFD